VLCELVDWQTRLSDPPADAGEHDPRGVLWKTIQYLEHNRERMHDPDDRRAGLPITTAWMASLVKELNCRVKGTEMFWNDPDGAEAILQLRAAAQCQDDRQLTHLLTRPGSPPPDAPNPPKPQPENSRADMHPGAGADGRRGTWSSGGAWPRGSGRAVT